MNYYEEDFSEEKYSDLLKLAKRNYEFADYSQYKNQKEKMVIWRHDIDVSMQRAYRLAVIERENGVHSTFFIHLHNEFYNIFEKENSDLLKKILDLGHHIGLHFDSGYYFSDEVIEIEDYLVDEKDIIKKFFNVDVEVFSFHNPSEAVLEKYTDEKISGTINTYSEYFRKEFGYCSDSNGYWRFRRLEDVLENAKEQRLQILTHPVWWTPSIMKPRDRIQRAIDGKGRKLSENYDKLLLEMGRLNVK